MAPQRARSGFSRIPLGRALIALGLVLVAINIAAALWDARTARERVEHGAQRDFTNLTRLLAEQTAASLESVDLLLRDAAHSPSALEVASQLPRLGEQTMHISHIAGFAVLDADGRVLARTGGIAPPVEALGTRRPGDPASAVRLSDPYQVGAGQSQSEWRFLLSRPLAAPPGGRPGGVIAAEVKVESFDWLYRTVDLGHGGFISLVTDDGVLVTRVPDPGDVRAHRYPAEAIMPAIRASGRFEGWTDSPISGEHVFLAASAVRGLPLVVGSGASEQAILAPWRDEAWLIVDRTALTSLAMLALIGLAAWGLNRREQKIARTWTRYQAMIEHSSDALILSRPLAGGIYYASPAIERVLGYTLQDLGGREVMDLIHPDTLETAMHLREELLRSPGKVAVDEVRVLHKDGSWRWIELTRKNLLEEPSVRALVFNFRDITERKQAEAERARLESRLRQAEKMEAVGRLAGGIAHDFNNILGGILGYAEMLSENAPASSPLKRYADNVLTGANRASGLVQQILSYSRSQRGQRQPVELGAIATETLELVRGSLPPAIELHAELLGTPLHVVGDATQLHQVTMNLCTNAVHAMGEGGVLRIRLERVEIAAERVLSHSTLHAGSYARLTVADTGSGMDEGMLARIFEPFFTTKEVGKGTGLGLALVYGIVTDSGGAIDVASAPGQGSSFAIYLPRVESPLAAEAVVAAPLAKGRGERVLVVDDEQALVAVTSEALKRIGYEPVGCPDGAAALAAFDAGHFDAVIADEVMPGLSGTQLARQLRHRRADLPIVLVSGYTGPMLNERALGVGITEVLKKPVQSREIAAALARVLKQA